MRPGDTDTRTGKLHALLRGKGLACDVSHSNRDFYWLTARPDDFLRMLEALPKARASAYDVRRANESIAEGKQQVQSYYFEFRLPK